MESLVNVYPIFASWNFAPTLDQIVIIKNPSAVMKQSTNGVAPHSASFVTGSKTPALEGAVQTRRGGQVSSNLGFRNRSNLPRLSILPVPDLLEKVLHVDSLALHLHNPWVFQHPPGSGAARGFFFEANTSQSVNNDLSIAAQSSRGKHTSIL